MYDFFPFVMEDLPFQANFHRLVRSIELQMDEVDELSIVEESRLSIGLSCIIFALQRIRSYFRADSPISMDDVEVIELINPTKVSEIPRPATLSFIASDHVPPPDSLLDLPIKPIPLMLLSRNSVSPKSLLPRSTIDDSVMNTSNNKWNDKLKGKVSESTDVESSLRCFNVVSYDTVGKSKVKPLMERSPSPCLSPTPDLHFEEPLPKLMGENWDVLPATHSKSHRRKSRCGRKNKANIKAVDEVKALPKLMGNDWPPTGQQIDDESANQPDSGDCIILEALPSFRLEKEMITDSPDHNLSSVPQLMSTIHDSRDGLIYSPNLFVPRSLRKGKKAKKGLNIESKVNDIPTLMETKNKLKMSNLMDINTSFGPKSCADIYPDISAIFKILPRKEPNIAKESRTMTKNISQGIPTLMGINFYGWD